MTTFLLERGATIENFLCHLNLNVNKIRCLECSTYIVAFEIAFLFCANLHLKAIRVHSIWELRPTCRRSSRAARSTIEWSNIFSASVIHNVYSASKSIEYFPNMQIAQLDLVAPFCWEFLYRFFRYV
jgi:uncharacterized membrane protein